MGEGFVCVHTWCTVEIIHGIRGHYSLFSTNIVTTVNVFSILSSSYSCVNYLGQWPSEWPGAHSKGAGGASRQFSPLFVIDTFTYELL